MALVINNRVRELTSTTGTGAVTLGGAVGGFQTFAAGIGNDNTTYYAISLNTANEWEVGLGTLNGDSSTLTRTTVLESSNSDSAVDFSAGSKEIFCTLPSEKALYLDASDALGNTGIITNTSVDASAAIALSKFATVTASRVLESSASGFVSASSVTSTTLGYLDATSSIQTQMNTKLAAVVDDTSPQLGGDLDLNSKNIDFPTVSNISDCLDEDDMSSDSATKLATQQSIKAYADAQGETFPTFTSTTPSTVTNDLTSLVIAGTNFGSSGIPAVEFQASTGVITAASSVVRDSASQLTVGATLPTDGTYFIRIELNTGLAVRSTTAVLTVSDAPVWTTEAGSLGTIAGNFSGTVATVAATGDTVAYTETTDVLENATLANCSLNSSTGVITTSDFGADDTEATTFTFTLRATDAQAQTADRIFTLTSSYGATGGGQFN